MKALEAIRKEVGDYISACLQAGMSKEAHAWDEALIAFEDMLRELGYLREPPTK